MANVETEQPARNAPSMVVQLALLAAVTVAALGVGWLAGTYLKRSEAPPQPPRIAHEKAEAATPDDALAVQPLAELPTITTNLAAPTDIWVRLDASVVYDTPQPPEMTQAIHQDLLAFMRTVKLHQVEGASGYQHLKADLLERASIRSNGHAKDVLIRTMLFE